MGDNTYLRLFHVLREMRLVGLLLDKHTLTRGQLDVPYPSILPFQFEVGVNSQKKSI